MTVSRKEYLRRFYVPITGIVVCPKCDQRWALRRAKKVRHRTTDEQTYMVTCTKCMRGYVLDPQDDEWHGDDRLLIKESLVIIKSW